MKRAALLALLLLAPVAAHAQGLDLAHGGPISITARDGIEWVQARHEVIARGDARAVRGNVTVIADRLIAYYRKKNAPVASSAEAKNKTGAENVLAGDDTSGNEIYRLEAVGHVQIFSPTDHAQCDRAVYDLDQAVVVMTGHDLRLTTPNEVLTARDDMEYWSQKRMAVARGDAVVLTRDHRRIAADVLVAYTSAAQPAATPAAASSAQDPLGGSGKLEKVEAFGHVSIRTPTDIVTGDRGVYVPASGIARLVGNVRITRGGNQLAGAVAEVNLKTGISRLLAGKSRRVEGLIVPNDATNKSMPPPATPGGRK